jgi:hypothetical protein
MNDQRQQHTPKVKIRVTKPRDLRVSDSPPYIPALAVHPLEFQV